MRKSNVPKFASPIFDPMFFVLIGTSLLCALLIYVREVQEVDYFQYRFLLWNLFLAWLPLIFSILALLLTRVAKGWDLAIGLTILGVAWLLLYPNAPYLTTDFIHLVSNPNYDKHLAETLRFWFDLVLFFLFSWCGLLLGYISMRHFHSIVSHYVHSWIGWIFVVVVSFLGGFGVYLGRVTRLNSWDVLFNPFRLIEGVLEGINKDAAIFTILFGMLILIVYVTLFTLGSNRLQNAQAAESGHS
ncbi:DUF1361 domain-containing protein [Cohnella herbarum]|uniref:DUF1361 domain-containing protein n=1 Tax=Cohnella herbarum TaxID=2728023 RepID=A0A7Z2VG39_9BACL|nr:DUF1361 domain-containing protein [Cohnella herbarum]QJD82244.1 DUF1361 domain-containing protein [Cohnella herbarum]